MGSTNKISEAGRDEKCQGILQINHIGNALGHSNATNTLRHRVGFWPWKRGLGPRDSSRG